MKPAPMTDFDVMQHIGNEFPLPLVQPIVIQKIETVVSAIIAARDKQWAELLIKQDPSRSKKLAAAGHTKRDDLLVCDSCGGRFSWQMLPAHKCGEEN